MTGVRPSDLALFLLASGDLLPRKRARDQQADIAGLELKRRVLDHLVALDPDPQDLERALLQIVETIGPPDGPTRAICGSIRDEWEAATNTPELMQWLIEQALRENDRSPKNREPRTENGHPQDQPRTGNQAIDGNEFHESHRR